MTRQSRNDETATYQARLEELLLRQRDRHRAQRLSDVDQRNQLQAALRTAETRLAEMSAEAARARAEVEAMRRSTSWRVTAPLRWLRQRASTAPP